MVRNQRGNALLLVLVVFATLFTLLGMSFDRGEQLLRRLQHQSLEQVALNLAEAGVEYALHQLALPGNAIEKTMEIDLETGSFSTSVSFSSSGHFEIMAAGRAKNGHRMEESVIKTLKVQGRFSPDEPDAVPIVTIWEEVL